VSVKQRIFFIWPASRHLTTPPGPVPSEPILAPARVRPADSPAPKPLASSRSAAKRSHTAVTGSPRADASEEDGAKRVKVKQEPMSDDLDLALVEAGPDASQQIDRTRKRDADDESANECDDDDEEDELMSSGSERLVRPPVRKAPRKKLRRRHRSASVGSEEESRSEAASDADMGSTSDHESRLAGDMSDDDDRSMSSGSRSPSPPLQPTQRTAKKAHKRVLSEVGSVSSSRPRSSLAKKRRKSNGAAPAPISEDEAGESLRPARQDSWEDPHGIKFRTGVDGRGSERLVLVKKQVRKFDMPADSEHPDREQTISANIEQWVNEREFAELKARRALAWQSDDEDGAEPTKMLEPADQSVVDGVNTVLLNSSSLVRSVTVDVVNHYRAYADVLLCVTQGRSAARKGTLYVAKTASGTPLRPSQSLTQMHELYTSSGLFSTASSRPASPASPTVGTPKMAGAGKLRFSSAAARVRGSPFSVSLARQAKEAEEQKRLDEELARKVDEEKKAVAVPRPAPAPTSAPVTAPPPASSSALSLAAAPGSPFSFSGTSKDTPAPALAPIPQPPAGAANPIAASASPSTATPATSPFNAFGAKPAATPQQPAAETPKPATGGFSFGAPTKLADPPAPAAASPKPSFSFGAPAAATPVAPSAPQPTPVKAPAFAFAAPSTSAAPAPSTPAEAPKASTFSFGTPSAPSPAPSAAPAAPATFAFGNSVSKPEAVKPALSKQPSFSFSGAPLSSPAPSTPASTPAPSFSFGASAATTTPAAAPAAAPASGGFSFGAAPAASAPAALSFAFGGNPSSSTPSFGGVSTAIPAGGSSTPSAPKFSFGAAASPAAPALGGASTPGSAPAPASFSFGAKPAEGAAPAAPTGTFSFGGAAGGFTFGK